MNINEFFASFLVWTPEPFAQDLVRRIYGSNALKKGGKLERLSRVRGSKSFYRVARAERSELKKIYGVVRDNREVNDVLTQRAKQQILAHPLRHIGVTFPIPWRGIFVERGLEITIPFAFQI